MAAATAWRRRLRTRRRRPRLAMRLHAESMQARPWAASATATRSRVLGHPRAWPCQRGAVHVAHIGKALAESPPASTPLDASARGCVPACPISACLIGIAHVFHIPPIFFSPCALGLLSQRCRTSFARATSRKRAMATRCAPGCGAAPCFHAHSVQKIQGQCFSQDFRGCPNSGQNSVNLEGDWWW